MANNGTKRGKMDLRWGGVVFGKKGWGGELGIIPFIKVLKLRNIGTHAMWEKT